MNSENKPKFFSNGFTGALAIIGTIAGTIFFVIYVFGEWYTDFDIEPTGLITGLLTIIVFLLPFAISLLLGGGIGLLVGGLLGTVIEITSIAIKTFICNKVNAARRKKKTRKASASIRKSNKSIVKELERLNSLRKELSSDPKAVITNYNLCKLVKITSNEYVGFEICEKFTERQYSLLSEIRSIEKHLLELANEYEVVGNSKQAAYYRSIANG